MYQRLPITRGSNIIDHISTVLNSRASERDTGQKAEGGGRMYKIITHMTGNVRRGTLGTVTNDWWTKIRRQYKHKKLPRKTPTRTYLSPLLLSTTDTAVHVIGIRWGLKDTDSVTFLLLPPPSPPRRYPIEFILLSRNGRLLHLHKLLLDG